MVSEWSLAAKAKFDQQLAKFEYTFFVNYKIEVASALIKERKKKPHSMSLFENRSKSFV